jgi:hypothetical protein
MSEVERIVTGRTTAIPAKALTRHPRESGDDGVMRCDDGVMARGDPVAYARRTSIGSTRAARRAGA